MFLNLSIWWSGPGKAKAVDCFNAGISSPCCRAQRHSHLSSPSNLSRELLLIFIIQCSLTTWCSRIKCWWSHEGESLLLFFLTSQTTGFIFICMVSTDSFMNIHEVWYNIGRLSDCRSVSCGDIKSLKDLLLMSTEKIFLSFPDQTHLREPGGCVYECNYPVIAA